MRFNVERVKILAQEDKSFNIVVQESFIHSMGYNYLTSYKEKESLEEYIQLS